MRRILLAVLVLAVVVPTAAATPRVPQVIGGTPAPAGKYPFTVALAFRGNGSLWENQYCAGTLIAPQRVITAAHCVADVFTDEIAVVAGRDNLLTGSGQTVRVDDIVTYPGYDATGFGSGDIAVLHLHRAITGIAPAAIATSLPAPGSDVQIVGWGRTNPDGAFPSQLQEATVQVVDDTACRDAYQTGFVVASMFCAGVPGGGVDTCSGDSGGPLLVDVAGTFQLAGVTDSGLSCALAGYPGLYARVTDPALRNWVLSDPPLLPQEDYPPSVTGSGIVGQTLHCHRGAWSSSVHLTYSYAWIRANDGTMVHTGTSYTPVDADRGLSLACVVTVRDASGNTTGDSALTDPIHRSANEATDVTAPVARTPSLTCSGSACTISVKAVDSGGSGLLRVELMISTVAPSGAVSMLQRDLRPHHGIARTALALPPGRHIVFARAVDRAGNRQRSPARYDDHGATRSAQVIGGTPTTTSAFPFVGAVVFRGVPSDKGLWCGGTLIAPTVVLTAAHCVAFSPPGVFDVVFGRTMLSGSDGERIGVTGVSWHPSYSFERLGNDVALLHLAHAPAGITPAPLISAGTAGLAGDGSPATIVGWGAIVSINGEEIYPDQIRSGDVVIQSNAACDMGVGGLFEPATMTCAAAGVSGQTTCHGDSGGPLLVDDAGTWTVAGITSFGLSCGSLTSPGVFTRILGVRDWLDTNPPAAPAQWGGVFITGGVRVGGTARCNVRVAGAGLVTDIAWYDGDRRVHSGFTWRIPSSRAGHDISCSAHVTNGGGSLDTTPSEARRVLANGHGDGRAPRLTGIRITCTGALGAGAPSCVAHVRASDSGSGVAAITLLIDAVAPGGGHVTRTTERERSTLDVTLPKLAHGTYRILATSVDRAGNRSAPQFVTRSF